MADRDQALIYGLMLDHLNGKTTLLQALGLAYVMGYSDGGADG